jgi:hypothetical protein
MRQLLIKLLQRLLYRYNFKKPYDPEKRLEILEKLNGNQILWDWKEQQYSRLFKEYFNVPEKNGEERLIIKGRMLEISDMLNGMENAGENLEKLQKHRVNINRISKKLTFAKGKQYLTNIKY